LGSGRTKKREKSTDTLKRMFPKGRTNDRYKIFDWIKPARGTESQERHCNKNVSEFL
jgi:hypothetical protein